MLTHDELIKLLRQRAKEMGSQKVLAIQMHVSEQYLSDVIHGKRMPNGQMLEVLGLELVQCYKRIRGVGSKDQDQSAKE